MMITKHRHVLVILLCIISCMRHIAGDETLNQKIRDIFSSFERSGTATEDLEDCECVDYFLCNCTHINTNGEGVIDIRGNDDQCESYVQICCKVSDKVVHKIVPIKNETGLKGSGYRNPDGAGLRTQGDANGEAKFGEFPWMAAVLTDIRLNDKILKAYQCGGSIIHPQAIITAAHCVSNKEKTYSVRAGEWDTQTEKEILPHQNRYVKSITIHPSYYAGALFNDVALLILETPLNFDEHINAVCLPSSDAVIPAGQRCWASGWGKDLFGAKGRYQVILKKIDLPIVDRYACQNALRTTRLGRYFQLHETFVCAGGEPGKDTCQGDGGSPLVCPISGQRERYQQVGIVAWGIGCGENNIPGVYANVMTFRRWIDAEMVKNYLETSQYQC